MDTVSLSNLLTFITRQYFLPKSLQYSKNDLSTQSPSSASVKAVQTQPVTMNACQALLRGQVMTDLTSVSSVKAWPVLKKHLLRLCTKREEQEPHERTGSSQPPSHEPGPEVARSAQSSSDQAACRRCPCVRPRSPASAET